MTESGKAFVGDTFGDGALPDIAFETFQPAAGSPYYLICPDNYCMPQDTPIAPTWAVPVSDLSSVMIDFADQRADVKVAKMNLADRQFDFLVTRDGKPWPDVITVRFISLGSRLSSVALFARTPVGTSTLQKDHIDFVTLWIDNAKSRLPISSIK